MSGHAGNSACGLWVGDGLCDAVACYVSATIREVREKLIAQRFSEREEREFLRLATWMQSVDIDHAHQVFSAPGAYHWSVIASELMQTLFHDQAPHPASLRYMEALGASSFSEAWKTHLGRFGLFAISVAHLAGESLTLDGTDLRLPQTLPATRYSFSNEHGHVQLIGIKSGRSIQFLVDGQPCSVDLSEKVDSGYETKGHGIVVHRAVEVEVGGQTLFLQPHEFNLGDLDEIRAVVASSPESQRGLTGEIESMLACLQSYVPKTFSRLVRSMRVLAFKPPESGGALAVADPLLPGAAVFTEGRHPLVLAEDFVRMDAASRCVLLQQSVCLSQRPAQPLGYSPWRDHPCTPLERFADALVFERVLAFWIAVVERQELAGIELEYAAFRIAKICRQLNIAIESLRSKGGWSESGEALLRLLASRVTSHQRNAETLSMGGDADVVVSATEGYLTRLSDRDGGTIRVDQMINEHLRRYSTLDAANQSA